MDWNRYQGWILLLLRLTAAFIFLWHGVPKAFDYDVGFQKFVDMSFPGFLGPIIGWIEVIASALLIIGYQTRWVSFVLAGVVVIALLAVQLPKGVVAAFERDLLLTAIMLALTVYGAGPFSVDKK
jgi:putative oxidoreductase